MKVKVTITYRSEQDTLLRDDEYEVVRFTGSGAIVLNKSGEEVFIPEPHYEVEQDGLK